MSKESAITISLGELKNTELWLRAMRLEGKNASSLLGSLGEELVSQSETRLVSEKTGPDGAPWEPWSEKYDAWRTKHDKNPGQGIGILTRHMLGGIYYRRVNQHVLRWGSSAEYASFFQGSEDGDESKGNQRVGRPFIGLSEKNEAALEVIAEEFLAKLGK